MTNLTTELRETELLPEEAETSLRNMTACVHRAAKLETLMLMLDMGVRLDAGRSVQEIMGRQV